MAEISKRRRGEHLRRLLQILREHPEGMRAGEALAELADRTQLTPYESGSYESGRRFEKIVRFATVGLVKAGWLQKIRGLWIATEEGIKAIDQFPDPEAFYSEVNRKYSTWRRANLPAPDVDEEADDLEDVEDEAPSITFEQAEEQAWSQIERHLVSMNPYEFQELVADLLRGMGYHVSWVAPPGKDRGVDIVAWTDPLGTRPPRIKVQVKRVEQGIDVSGLRSFLAVLGDDDVGLYVCSGGFTKDARDEARNQESRKVTLLDLKALFDLWVEHYPRLDESAKRRLPLQPIHFLAPEV